jgi:serine/threonine protein kinase
METRPWLVAGRYELRASLGRGGMGEVYAGWDRQLEREVAVKVLPAEALGDGALRRRVEAEARTAAAVAHPNVVTVFDSGEDEDGDPFIVMEKLDGGNLADAIAHGPMDPTAVRRMAVQVLAALGAAHAIGLIHRDVKPSNILAAGPGWWKVADFGIAKSTDAAVTATAATDVFGSPAYLAPERVAGSPATERSDLYSVGVVMYEALTGRKPFDEANPIATAMRIREGTYRPLRAAAPHVDASLAGVVDKAMALEPADRFATAAEMAAVVHPGSPPGERPATRSPAPVERTARLPADGVGARVFLTRSSRVALATALIGLVALIVVTVVAVALLADAAPQPSPPARRSAAASPSSPLEDALDRLERTITP